MTLPQKNTVLAAGIVAGLLSLPMTWFTLQQITFPPFGGTGSFFGQAPYGLSLRVTALTGSVTLLVQIPLWFLVMLAVVASVLPLMRHTGVFAIPSLAEWITAVSALLGMAAVLLIVLSSGQASLGVGWILGVLSALAPLVCLCVATTTAPTILPDSPAA